MKESLDILFEKFLKAPTCKATLQTFRSLCKEIKLKYPPERGASSYEHVLFYTKLKQALGGHWKAQSLFTKLDKKFDDELNLTKGKNSRNGQERAAKDLNVLIVGAGPCGLRTAIFTALLGAKTVVVEKRDSFSRNNVLHLWPFTIEDLKGLGAKKFNGRFCSGAIDHVSIRQLQLILMKCALIFGVEIHVNTAFIDLVPPNVEGVDAWKAKFDPENSPLNDFGFNVIVGADGRKNTLKGFEKKTFRGSLAIGITVNFINKRSNAEAQVSEISGINFIYRQEFFRELNMKHGIDLENIVYYKDDTHYFVMTARKQSLLERRVLKENLDEARDLVHVNNIDQKALLKYALDAVNFSTENKLPDLEVAINNYGLPDIALFDFTCMKSAVNASMFQEVNGVKLLKGLVGDGLLEPFWPKGTGIAKGFLAAYDTCWMIRRWALGRLQDKPGDRSLEMSLLAERESLYRMLAQIESNNLVQNYAAFSLDPKTRYQYTPPKVTTGQVRPFYVTDRKEFIAVPETVEVDGKLDADRVPSRLTRNISFVRSNKLLQWCQKVLKDSGSNILVTNMSSSWKSGLALCSIISYYRPDIMDSKELKDGNAEFNNQLAFDVAESHLGVTPIMSGKEMAECEAVDDLVMVTYLSQFYEIFKNETPVHAVGRVSDILPTPKEDLLPKAGKKKTSPLGIITKVKQQFKRKTTQRGSNKEYDLKSSANKRRKTGSKQNNEVAHENPDNVVLTKAVLPTIPDEGDKENTVVMRGSPKAGVRKNATNRISALGLQLISQLEQNSDVATTGSKSSAIKSSNSSVCYFCGKTVYIVERLSVEGLFFHRQCFKCSHCDTILRPLNYKRDDDTGKFYCNVHYFANAKYLKQKVEDGEDEKVPQSSQEPMEEDAAQSNSLPSSPASPVLLSPVTDDHNLSVPTIEHGQVVMRRDLTPKRSDMEQFSLLSSHFEIEEEALNEHNMRCSRTSDSEDELSSDSEDEEWDEIAARMTGLNGQSPQEILSNYHKEKERQRSVKEDDSAFISSCSEGDEDLSSLSGTSADDTALMNQVLQEVEAEDDDSDADKLEQIIENGIKAKNQTEVYKDAKSDVDDSSSQSSESFVDAQLGDDNNVIADDEFLELEDADLQDPDVKSGGEPTDNEDSPKMNVRRKDTGTLESVEKYIKEHPITKMKPTPTSSSSSENNEKLRMGSLEVRNEEGLQRQDTLKTAEERIRDHPIETSQSMSSISSFEESKQQDIPKEAMPSESLQEDMKKNTIAEVGSMDANTLAGVGTKNDTSVWFSTPDDSIEAKSSVVEPEVMDTDVITKDDDVAELATETLYPEDLDFKKHDSAVIASTPKVTVFTPAGNKLPVSPFEVFATPCAKSDADDTFYSVKSNQSSGKISHVSRDSMNDTMTSENDSCSNISDSVQQKSSKKLTDSDHKISETPKVKTGRRRLPVIPHLEVLSPSKPQTTNEQTQKVNGRRRLPVIPHLEVLSPSADEISPKQRERIEKKLKKHEDRVMARIRKMKMDPRNSSASDNTSIDTTQESDLVQEEDKDDFVNHIPMLLQRRSNALRKRKPRFDKSKSEKSDGWFNIKPKKKENKSKPQTSPVPTKVMSPTHRSSRKRDFSSYTQEEIDSRVSYRVKLAAEKQAREAERKRMARALVIQGQLQEVDTKRKHLEERGVELEKLLRGQKSQGVRPRDSSFHMHEWFKLVQEKNALLRYENELMIYQRELQLEDKQSRLQQSLRERMAVDDAKKSPAELAEEKKMLADMMSIIEQRDQLVALLDEHRVHDQEESNDIQRVVMEGLSGLELTPSQLAVS